MNSQTPYFSIVLISLWVLNAWSIDISGPIVRPFGVEDTHSNQEKRSDLIKRVEHEVVIWDSKIARLKEQTRSTRIWSRQRARLKKTIRELEKRRSVVLYELSQLREIAELKSERIRDDINSEFRHMKEAYDSILAE